MESSVVMTNDKVERLIDANINRLREGLRVIEDINRYIYDNGSLSSRLKNIRHLVSKAYDIDRLTYRDIINDVSKSSTDSEMIRESIDSVIIANFSRVQESARVLEEIFKLKDLELSNLFKEIRYEIYDIEKEFFTNR